MRIHATPAVARHRGRSALRSRLPHQPRPRSAAAFLAAGLLGAGRDLSAAGRTLSLRRRGGRLTWPARARLAGCLLIIILIVLSPIARASSGETHSSTFSWFDTKGASGITMGQYVLDLDNGQITDPGKAVLSILISLTWDIYREGVGVAIWLYNEATGFGWLNAMRPPAEAVNTVIYALIGYLGIAPLMLTAAAFICGMWMLRGRWAGGFAELIVSCLIATAFSGFLVNPVDTFAGQNGLLGRSQQFGLELSATIASLGQADSRDPALLRQQTSGALVDAFLRGPHQLVNYGAVVDDNPKCAAVYTKVLQAGPYDDSTARDRMGDCDKAYGDYAANPSTSQLSGMLVLLPGAVLLLALMLALVLALFVASAIVVFEAAKLTIGLLKGIIPGAGRDGLYQGLATLAVSLAIVIGALGTVSGYVLVIREALQVDPAHARDPAATFLVMDLLLITAIVVMFRWRSQAKEAASRMAERLARLSPGGATRGPASHGTGWRTAVGVAGGLAGTRLTAYALGSTARRGMGDALDSGPPANPSSSLNSRGGASTTAAGATAAGRLQQRMQAYLGPANTRYARIWGKVGKTVLAGTIGAPVYGPRLVKAAPAWSRAKSAALRTTLASAARHPATQNAGAFAREYGHNVAAAARTVSRYSGANFVSRHAARAAARGATAPAAAAVFAAGSSQTPGSSPRVAAHAPHPQRAARPAGPRTQPAGPVTVPAAPPGVRQSRRPPAPVRFQGPGQEPKDSS